MHVHNLLACTRRWHSVPFECWHPVSFFFTGAITFGEEGIIWIMKILYNFSIQLAYMKLSEKNRRKIWRWLSIKYKAIINYVCINSTNFNSRARYILYRGSEKIESCRRKYFSPRMNTQMILVISFPHTLYLGYKPEFLGMLQNKVVENKRWFTALEIYTYIW